MIEDLKHREALPVVALFSTARLYAVIVDQTAARTVIVPMNK